MNEKMRSKTILLLTALLTLVACQQKQKTPVASNHNSADLIYTCPMHPGIMEDHPGSCPICGMTLVQKSAHKGKAAGINLKTVLKPVNTSVITSVKSIVPEEKRINTTVQAYGYLDFDTRTFNNIAARFSGRIEKLYVKYAFQQIHKGQRIFDIYSPDMVTAQQDLLFLVKNSPQETGLIYAATQKLILLGITKTQIIHLLKTNRLINSIPIFSPYEGHVHDVAHSQMSGTGEYKPSTNYANNTPLAITEGMYVKQGQTLFNVVDPHKLWAIIKINQPDIKAVKLGQPVQISIPDVKDKTINGIVNFIEPTLQEGDKSISIRVYINNMHHYLKVNTQVKATIHTGVSSGLWLPNTAVISLGRQQIVWIKNGESYIAHEVAVGISTDKEIQIRHGITLKDSVASHAAYLSDSESYIKARSHD
jgi:Cu(I)/Ag(I) efflux system membrane fusion protein